MNLADATTGTGRVTAAQLLNYGAAPSQQAFNSFGSQQSGTAQSGQAQGAQPSNGVPAGQAGSAPAGTPTGQAGTTPTGAQPGAAQPAQTQNGANPQQPAAEKPVLMPHVKVRPGASTSEVLKAMRTAMKQPGTSKEAAQRLYEIHERILEAQKSMIQTITSLQ